MKRGAIIFDFDGTIADSEATGIQIYEDFTSKYGLKKVSKSQYREFRDLSAKEAIKKAGIRFWQLPRLVKTGREQYQKYSPQIKLFAGIYEVAAELSQDYDLFILSSSSQATVRSILDNNKFKPKIVILKTSSIFGKHNTLKKLIRSYGYDPKFSWMIGDEVRDIEAGERAGLNTIGVTWGLQSKKAIKRAQPTEIADQPRDILRILENDNNRLTS